MAFPFFTIGHATRSLEELVDALRLASVELLVDVRSVPRSRTNPQFNKDTLPGALSEFQMGYQHFAELGGLRGRQLDGPSPNDFWQNGSFRNYADYAMSEPFQSALARLRQLGADRRCAIMCSEMVWWRCHRRIIADYLIAAGEAVFHILGQDRHDEAQLTAAARLRGGGILVYPKSPPDKSGLQLPNELLD